MADAQTSKFLTYMDYFLRFIDADLSQEYESLCIARSLEECRGRWQRVELELRQVREALLKCEIDRSALQVKLKHARNQVDVEMRKRHRAETQAEKMERQMQLIGDLLMSDGLASRFLNESLLAALSDGPFSCNNVNAKHRLSTIDESCTSFTSHSDISYDQTEDLELDLTIVKPARPRPAERRHWSLAPLVGPPVPAKRTKTNAVAAAAEPINEPVVTQSIKMIPDSGGPIQAASTIEALPRRRSHRSRLSLLTGQTAVWSSSDESETLPQISELEPESEQQPEPAPQTQMPSAVSQEQETAQHNFMSKTVIRVETCAVCGKRSRFGKVSLKCKECRLVVHPECRAHLSGACVPRTPGPVTGLLADFAPSTAPWIPHLVLQCIREIDLRGLREKGIYRVPGCDRQVKELRQKMLHGKGDVDLGRVQDIHVVCGVLKDFLRNLREPLVTFQLHSHFMEAAEIVSDADNRAEMCQVIRKLPPANRETLAFLILHLHRVMQSPDCKMNQTGLARVFGPTIVGHRVVDPSPLMIMQDTPRQSKVVASLLSLPVEFWNQFLSSEQENLPASVSGCKVQDERKEDQSRLFRPLTSPEINAAQGTLSTGCLPNKIRNVLVTPFAHAAASHTKSSQAKKNNRFFTSPNA
ncbi:rac GTPase-activating protein 1-like isoform X2 [Rhinatrema bivittatum]|uniref:rac GTPase-activating protein 1-like isoform X2 n=1 Tax=Rhinatrema bivittatum TaxID=194408 RepID=UPI00112D96AC|nr:rac GTPase-activating protein 1-like isoform X2 [Rhinatrema bivittatum]